MYIYCNILISLISFKIVCMTLETLAGVDMMATQMFSVRTFRWVDMYIHTRTNTYVCVMAFPVNMCSDCEDGKAEAKAKNTCARPTTFKWRQLDCCDFSWKLHSWRLVLHMVTRTRMGSKTRLLYSETKTCEFWNTLKTLGNVWFL